MDERCIPVLGSFISIGGDEQIDPHKLLLQISDGVISKEAWAAKCKELGIENIPLAASAATPAGLPLE